MCEVKTLPASPEEGTKMCLHVHPHPEPVEITSHHTETSTIPNPDPQTITSTSTSTISSSDSVPPKNEILGCIATYLLYCFIAHLAISMLTFFNNAQYFRLLVACMMMGKSLQVFWYPEREGWEDLLMVSFWLLMLWPWMEVVQFTVIAGTMLALFGGEGKVEEGVEGGSVEVAEESVVV